MNNKPLNDVQVSRVRSYLAEACRSCRAGENNTLTEQQFEQAIVAGAIYHQSCTTDKVTEDSYTGTSPAWVYFRLAGKPVRQKFYPRGTLMPGDRNVAMYVHAGVTGNLTPAHHKQFNEIWGEVYEAWRNEQHYLQGAM